MKQISLFPDIPIPERKSTKTTGLDYQNRSTVSLSALLLEFSVQLTSRRANDIFIKQGVLEELERVSSQGKIKYYKAFTKQGQQFGRNEVYPMSPNQTQPRYYREEFEKLLKFLIKK